MVFLSQDPAFECIPGSGRSPVCLKNVRGKVLLSIRRGGNFVERKQIKKIPVPHGHEREPEWIGEELSDEICIRIRIGGSGPVSRTDGIGSGCKPRSQWKKSAGDAAGKTGMEIVSGEVSGSGDCDPDCRGADLDVHGSGDREYRNPACGAAGDRDRIRERVPGGKRVRYSEQGR